MKQYMKVDQGILPCNYIDGVEYARRMLNPGKDAFHPEQSLKMQILVPKLYNQKVPVIMFVVGGGYRAPRVSYRVPWMVPLAEMGFVVAMPEYRGAETDPFPASIEDLRDAIRFVRKNIGRYGGDPDKIVLLGGSAGAHLCLLTAYTDLGRQGMPELQGVSDRVSGVIDLYGPTDLRTMIPDPKEDLQQYCRSMPVRFVGTYDPRALFKALEPTVITRYISRDRELPPTMIAHGDADTLVPMEQSDILYEALEQAGKNPRYYVMKGAGHANPRFFEEEMMKKYADFVRRVTADQE